MSHVPTGYPRRRPRTGEVREPSIGGLKAYEYRTGRIKRDPTYLEQLAKAQRDWVAKNPEKKRENARAYRERNHDAILARQRAKRAAQS